MSVEPTPKLEGRVPPVPTERETLRTFPTYDLAIGTTVWRVHETDSGPWYFGDAGRFGLLPKAGTCYVAADPITTICETVIRGRTHICPADLASKRIRGLVTPKLFAIADGTNAIHFGLGRVFGTEVPYDTCREWAAALYETGFRGIAYWPSHDPRRGDHLSLALFDAAGERKKWLRGRADSLAAPHWQMRIVLETRIAILDPPDDDDLDFVE
ncbi:MAG: hypothetical protein QOD83_3429 [Solirubrobacteraceae bacterium]|jgi:hypothetical protein|nr:hypothetical protein [Solirubrobacteraceae bacterium]